jgi:NDP-sugar pyrophosphorylase family protein
VHPEARLVPPVYVGPGAVVEAGARVGSLAVLGEGTRLGDHATVENAVVGSRTVIGDGCSVNGSIVGDDASLGAGCEVRSLCVVGPGASIGVTNELDHGLRIAAGQQIPDKALRFS